MRTAIALTLVILANPTAALADRQVAVITTGGTGTVSISSSYSLNAPVTAATPEAEAAEERAYRKAMYARAARECEDLLETIATACRIESVNVSAQINRYPGQPATFYVSSSVSMQVTLKP